MSTEKLREPKKTSVNILLASVAMLIFGGLSLIFITQMDLQAGWTWDGIRNDYPSESNIIVMDDINGDGIAEIALYLDVNHGEQSSLDNSPKHGGLIALDGKTGKELWNNNYNDPVKNIFLISDCNNDTINDLFVCKANNPSEWTQTENGEKAYPIPDQNSNFLVSGKTGIEIPIVGGIDTKNFTNNYISKLVQFDTIDDNVEDFICLEYIYNHSESGEDYYNETITGYHINGTMKKQDLMDTKTSFNEINSDNTEISIQLLDYNGISHLLYIKGGYYVLINLTSQDNYSSYIYDENISGFNQLSHEVIEDLDGNGIPEILFVNSTGAVKVINGTSGELMYEQNDLFTISSSPSNAKILEFSTNAGDNSTYILLSIAENVDSSDNSYNVWEGVFSVSQSSLTSKWTRSESINRYIPPYIIDSDINGDSLSDLLVSETINPIYSSAEIKRYSIIDALNYNKVYGVMNIREQIQNGIISIDFDSDGHLDLVGVRNNKVLAIATIPPISLWNSPRFILGLPLTIICVIFILLGIVLIVWKGRELRFNIKKSVDENKLTLIVDAIGITLITISFVLFLIQIDIFSFTLVLGDPMTDIGIVFIIVSILWYTLLPLTAAVYNQFSPYFAYFFIKLRNVFFKISKSYNTEIIVMDMGERHDLGLFNKLKRIILPMLLSIAIGFYTYNITAPLLGYSQSFTSFGSTEFFSFISGYTLLCTLPMALSFLIFSFLIAGTALLDDAGISYYRESKKFRGPGDIEPISYWAQSLIKGIAGLSAIISFIGFFSTVDFSGFFRLDNQGIQFLIFGIFIVVVMFWTQPFITSLSYMLLAEDVMDFTHKTNVKQLYKKMEKGGFDITPRKLGNLYPSGFKSSKETTTIGKSKET